MARSKVRSVLAFVLVAGASALGPGGIRAAGAADLNVWTSNGPSLGVAVSDLAANPTVPGVVYAAAGNLGIYATVNGGGRWRPSNSGLPSQPDIGALAVDPSAPPTVYAGGIAGAYKSTDGGAHWTLSSNGIPTGDVV